MVLAAGLGSRLGTLSDELPKPLLPVVDVPLVRYVLALLAGHGIDEVAINLHHRGDLIVTELEGASKSMKIHWSREEAILGTGGGIRRAGDWLTDGGREPFFVLNGKLVIDVDLGRLAECHRASGAIGTMVVREVSEAERWGAIDVDASGRVVKILGEGKGDVARRTMFAGVHVLSPEFVERLPDGKSCAIRQGYLPSLRAGARIDSYLYHGYFQEHSTPERYLSGNRAVLSGEARLSHWPGEVGGIDESARIGPGVNLVPPYRIGAGAVIGAGATVGPFAVIGHGAHVEDVAHIREAVVWPGATARGLIENAIVTPRGVHEVGPH